MSKHLGVKKGRIDHLEFPEKRRMVSKDDESSSNLMVEVVHQHPPPPPNRHELPSVELS